MDISYRRVLIAGLISGMVIIISAVTMVPVVGDEMEQALARFNLPPMSIGAMLYFMMVSLSFGVVLVWIYAAILPSMASGFKAIIVSAFIVWFLAVFLANVSMVVYGFMPVRLTVIGTLWGLIELLLGGIVGAHFYRVEKA